jgi:energy-coupling factor transporter ATP-binding protein EcfA2
MSDCPQTRGLSEDVIAERAARSLEMVGLTGYENTYPANSPVE